MFSLAFSAIGTQWVILLDHSVAPVEKEQLEHELLDLCRSFDQKYSRFLPHSWLNSLKTSPFKEKTVTLSQEEKTLFSLGLALEKSTDSHFSLNIADELSQIGYDEHYTLQKKAEPLAPKGKFAISDSTLKIQGRVAFDLGAFGKGALIDLLAQQLKKEGYQYFLVDGSGDFFGTSKQDGSGWRIALEHPENALQAIGTFVLKNQGFASSSPLRRTWGDAHHILNARSGKPVQSRVAVFTIAATATWADAFSTAIFVAPPPYWSNLQNIAPHEWCVLEKSEYEIEYKTSPNFSAELFSH